jgi:hypothetical protein
MMSGGGIIKRSIVPQSPSPRSYGERVASECEPGEGRGLPSVRRRPITRSAFAMLRRIDLSPRSGER